jgi:hypothetical protein
MCKHYHAFMAEVRECAQCGTGFTPRREHARFCSAVCRIAWNRAHDGVAAAPAVAIDWSVTAMAEAVGRFERAWSWELPRAAVALSETVWWITLIDATLVRYHPRDYESAMVGQAPGGRRKIEHTLGGLRYVRNLLGYSIDPAQLIRPGPSAVHGTRGAGWIWSPLPEPDLAGTPPDAREWELSRYHSYLARLAGRDVARTFAGCAAFLEQAAAEVSAA